MEEQAIVLTFGGVDVVAQPYLLATSTQASLLGGVGVEQVIEEEGTVLHGRREEGTETCDDLCDQLVAIVPRGDAHTPKTNRSARCTEVCKHVVTSMTRESTVFFEFGLFGHDTFWLVAQTGQIMVNKGRLIWIALVKSFPTIPIDLG